MRCESQPYDNMRAMAEIIDEAGVGQTGLTVTCTIRRSNGDYHQSAGGWGASPSNHTMTELSAANHPGVYVQAMNSADFDPSDGEYVVTITEPTFDLRENVRIVPELPGDQQRVLLGLRQENMRFIPSAWDSVSKQPTAGTVYVYASADDYDADTVPDGTGAIASWTIAAVFVGGQLSHYGSKRSS